MYDDSDKLLKRMRYICNEPNCGYSHDSYWIDFDHCMNLDCESKNITKVSLIKSNKTEENEELSVKTEILSDNVEFSTENENIEIVVKKKRGRPKKGE